MSNTLYYLDVEVKAASKRCKLSPDVLGAVVNCYVFESSVKKAKAKILQALDEDNYEVVQVNDGFEVSIDGLGRTAEIDDDEIDNFINSDDVLYGKFYGWKKE